MRPLTLLCVLIALGLALSAAVFAPCGTVPGVDGEPPTNWYLVDGDGNPRPCNPGPPPPTPTPEPPLPPLPYTIVLMPVSR